MVGDDDIRIALREVAEFLRERGEDCGYGFYRPENPHDFTPDSENTPEEIAAHRAACEAWDRGEYEETRPPTAAEMNEAAARGTLPAGVESATMASGTFVHVTFAPWGPGSYVIRDEEMLRMAARLDQIADGMPGPSDD